MACEKLSVKGIAFAGGILWGAGVLFVGVMNLIFPWYGDEFLKFIASVYPLYEYLPSPAVGHVIMATVMAVIDGAIAGIIFAWIYNLCAGKKQG